jgi:hypothetical protein
MLVIFLARQFYSHIQVTNDDHANGDNVKTISQQLIGKVNPQELLSSELFSQQQALGQEPGKLSAGYAFFIMALAAFVNITIGIVFLSTFLLFIARVVGLWFMMIFSPIAFASLALPGGGSFLGQFGWNGWRDNILKLSFMAPIFLFFLFLLVMFLQIIMPGTPADTSTQTIMGILIPFIVIIVVLRQAKKIAADMAGEFGGALQGAFSKIAGTAFTMAGGAVVGVAAYSGRKVIGGAASRRLASGVDQDRVARYNLQAGVSDRAAKEAKTVEERKRHEAEAKQSRRLASWNASKVKASAYLKNKATFDGRRSSTLSRIGGGINSVANFASKDVLGGSAVKLSLGKPTDKTQAKDEKEIAKNRLATAQLYSKEDLPGNGNESLKDIMSAADKGMDHQNDVLEHIDKYIEEIDKSDHFTEKEKEQRIRSAKDWRNSAESAQTDEELKKSFSARTASETVTNDKGEKVEQKITYNAPTELVSEGTSQRKAYADQTDYSNSLRYFNPLNKYAKEKLVNDIRSNKKNDDPKEMLKKIAKDLGFVEKGESKSDEPEKPKDDDKK